MLAFLGENYDTIAAVISYHAWWPSSADPFYLANVPENTTRVNYYGVWYTPDGWIDGTTHGTSSWTTWQAKMLNRHMQESPLEIELDATLAGVPMGGSVTATVRQTEPSAPVDLRLRFVIVESGLASGAEVYDNVFRDMFPDTMGIEITTVQGDSVIESALFAVAPAWDLAQSEIVVFVQSDYTHEVVQTAKMAIPLDVPYLSESSVAVDDAGGDGDGRAEDGETVDVIITLENGEGWLDATNVSAVLRTGDPDLTVIDSTGTFPDIPGGSSGDNAADPFTLSVVPGAEPHLAEFVIEITAAPDNFVPTDSFSLIIGHPAVILVDDDGGDDLEEAYRTVLAESLNVFHDEWCIAEEGSPQGAWLSNSQVAIWFTGADTMTTLEPNDIAALTYFLDQGGRLFITGSGIGRDIGQEPFYGDYLHAGYAGTTMDYVAWGVAGHPLVGESLLVLLWTETKEMISVSAGDSMLYYDTGGVAAVTYAGDYQVVYFGFRFDAIEEGAPVGIRKHEMMGRILDWMGITKVDGEEDGEELVLGEPPRLLGRSRPNPFSDLATIHYLVPGRASEPVPVRLSVYNILGQQVRTLVDATQVPGEHAVTWDGRSAAGTEAGSGIYFLRLEAGGASEAVKLVRVRGARRE